jgi:transposase
MTGFAEVSDELWQRIEPLVPRVRSHSKRTLPVRQVFNGILYVLKTGCQWAALPAKYGSKSAVHERLQSWEREGFLDELRTAGLLEHSESSGLDLDWQSMDGTLVVAPTRGKKRTAGRPGKRWAAIPPTGDAAARRSLPS